MSDDASERIIVIGAGSTGSSISYNLTKSGQQVVLIDRGQIAQGMTGLSSAIIRTHYSNETVAKMALYSIEQLRLMSSETGFVASGFLILSPSRYANAIKSSVAMLRRLGADEITHTQKEARKMFPLVNFDDVDCIAYEPKSGYADPVATTTLYANRAKESGAQILLGLEVDRFRVKNGEAKSILLTNGRELHGAKFIVCTNIWTNQLLARSGVAEDKLLPLKIVPHPVVVYRRPDSLRGTLPIIADYRSKAYYKPEGQVLLMGGSLDARLDKTSVSPDEFPTRASEEYVEKFSEGLVTRMEAMRNGRVQTSYYGLYDTTPDEHPILDELSALGLSNVYACVGLSGHGFKLCPAFGVMLTEMILGYEKSQRTFDWSIFSLSRFTKRQEIQRRYEGIGTVA